MTPTSRNRFIAIGAILVAGGALALIAWGGMAKDLIYYWTPGQLLEQGDKAYGPMIRLGGLVVKDSIKPEGTVVKFTVADGKGTDAKTVPVECTQTPPQMFREGIGVVVEGRWERPGVFKTNRLMVNHSNEYRPPKEGEAPHDMKDAIKDATDAPMAPGSSK